MTFNEANRQLKKVGTNNATGDALACMYAQLVAFQHGGTAQTYFKALKVKPSDKEINEFALELLRGEDAAWTAL